MAAQWICTVCGYIHGENDPPDNCPVCGVDRIKFKPLQHTKISLLQDMLKTFQPHAVAAHFPNALLPTALLFSIIALVFVPLNLSDAAWYLLLILLLAVPASLVTGVYEWKTRFAGKPATIFKRKIQLASLLIILLLITVGLRFVLGDPLAVGGLWKWLFMGLLCAMFGCVSLLGHYGGKLVFSLMNRK